MLGEPVELRNLAAFAEPAQAREVVRRTIDALERVKAGALDDLDAFARSMAEEGMTIESSKALIQLRRYEAACLRRFDAALRRLTPRRSQPEHAPAPPRPSPPQPPPAFRRPEPAASVPWPCDEAIMNCGDGDLSQLFAGTTIGVSAAPASASPAVVPSTPHLNRRERRAARVIAARKGR
jgi:hypothetical protein